ncbi:hypothetical protein [Flavihumibacter petaseus]|uniref:Uncharacterized protein n=1 Tax=Flavihumibacter petaseus NBRC 106054 TaxID=1220578 RepID=A0A0E9MWB9_9BACT|nr:hypothetical protein [Flavihumibacter petaseus]GAO42032.1 hypothetical protein FPE01S_01_10450 [Flavihumibacter petaseus NBRC 106054]
MRRCLILAYTLVGVYGACLGQSLPDQEVPVGTGFEKVLAFPAKLSRRLTEQQSLIEAKLERQTEKYLRKLQRQEAKMRRKLAKQDSALAASLNLGSDSLYDSWKQTLSGDSVATAQLPKNYSGKIDSMTTALNFLQRDPRLARLQGPQFEKLKNQYGQIGNQVNQTERLRQLVQERKALLKEKLANMPLGKTWNKYQKQAVYYQQQLEEYRQALQDPNMLEKKALEILTQVPAFRKFFDKYSVLGSMFRLPGQLEDMDPTALTNGLQTRDAVLSNITQRMGSTQAAQEAMSSGMQQGQAELESLKRKLDNALENGESLDMPGFKPNDQRTKSFFKRLELGTNLQTVRSNSFYPATSDFALSLGYKLNKKSVIGIGASYKMGWGQDIQHIKITHQGMGIRTFLDMKIKKSFWLTGGGEWNYREPFEDLAILKSVNQWQQSVLFGIQKKQQLGKYKSTISVLYDALWQRQLPKGQPLLFRVGYNLK